jgi:hypothetical protein
MADDKQKQRHPETSYDAEYYFNKKSVTESGHEFEFDDTPGKERIRLAHRSGSYMEFSSDGRRVDSIKGHLHSYVQGGMTQTVDNNTDLKYNGNLRVSSAGQHIEIDGPSTTVVSDKYGLMVKSGASIIILDDLYIIAKNVTLKADADINIEAGGSVAIKANGGDINFVASGGISGDAQGGNFQTKSSAKTIIDVGSTLDTKSGGTTTMKAPRIDLNP